MQEQKEELSEELLEILQANPYLHLADIDARLDLENGLDQGSGLSLIYHLAP
ncbi:MAG: TnsA endonuclease C-terminal domain-containing protein [Clostridia bacterium]|nr:TnsA endonuclease C-terminal domain-containing protein [Clostridia bacterium]